MERKFKKSDFRIAGNRFLLKSFLEEAKSRYGIGTFSDVTYEHNDVILEDNIFKGGSTRPEKYRLYQLPQHYQQAMDEIATLEIKEVEFKEGQWYCYKDGSVARYEGSRIGYGWDVHHYQSTGKYECVDVCMTNTDYQGGSWREATEKEIEEALIKIATERGFKTGVRYRDISRNGNLANYTLTAEHEPQVYTYTIGDDGEPALICGYANGFIYINKHWAEIVTVVTPDVTVGGKKGKFADDGVTFGCTFISKSRIAALYNFMDKWNDEVNGDNSNLTLEALVNINGTSITISQLKQMFDYYFTRNESTGN